MTVHVGVIVVDTESISVAAKVAVRLEKRRPDTDRGTVQVNGKRYRWKTRLAFDRDGGFGRRRYHPASSFPKGRVAK